VKIAGDADARGCLTAAVRTSLILQKRAPASVFVPIHHHMRLLFEDGHSDDISANFWRDTVNQENKEQPQQGDQNNKPGQQGQQPGQNPWQQQTQQPHRSPARTRAKPKFEMTPPNGGFSVSDRSDVELFRTTD
jgi:hypothetical protein